MKKPFSLSIVTIILTTAISGCTKTENNAEIQSGDIIFVSLPMNYSISGTNDFVSTDTTTERNYIHVAVLDVDDDGKTWVIDATLKHGVDRHPLDTFLMDFTLKDGSLPSMEVMRLKDDRKVAKYMKNIKKYLGEEYDDDFIMDNGRHYCSELIYDAYADGHKHVFDLGKVDFRNSQGIIPLYWNQLFGIINHQVPQDNPGILPKLMYDEGKLKKTDIKITK